MNMGDEIRRNMALFPIGIVMKLTDLSARQIRYYGGIVSLFLQELQGISVCFPLTMLRDC